MSDERKGAPSCSAFWRIHNCPGSHLASRGIQSESGPDAESGTLIHEALAGYSEPAWGCAVDALTNDERETAERCIALRRRALAGTVWEDAGKCSHVIAERRLWSMLGPLWSGKPDLVLIRCGRACVIDYKTGRGDVERAEGNMQLRGLAVLVAQNLGAESVRVMIIQPHGDPQVSACDYGPGDLVAAEKQIKEMLVEAAKPDALRRPGNWCKYCPALPTCPAALSVVVSVGRGNLQSVVTTEVLDTCRVAKLVIEKCESAAKEYLAAGCDIPGYRLKPGEVVKTIIDPSTVYSRAAAVGVSQAEFLGCVSVGKGKLEKAVKLATWTAGKGLAAQMDGILAGCVEERQNAPSLERVS